MQRDGGCVVREGGTRVKICTSTRVSEVDDQLMGGKVQRVLPRLRIPERKKDGLSKPFGLLWKN